MIPYDNKEFHFPKLEQRYLSRIFNTTFYKEKSYSINLHYHKEVDTIMVSTFEKGTPTQREIISDPKIIPMQPNISCDKTGNLFAVWTEKRANYRQIVIKTKIKNSWKELPNFNEDSSQIFP